MKANDFRDLVYKESEKDYGTCPPPISAEKSMKIMIEHFLGKDWHVVMPLCQEQVYTEAIFRILELNPKPKNIFKRIFNAIFSE